MLDPRPPQPRDCGFEARQSTLQRTLLKVDEGEPRRAGRQLPKVPVQLEPLLRVSAFNRAGNACSASASGAFGPSIDPSLNDRAELFLAPRRWLAPGAGTPAPRYQFVLGHVLV
jgi:hypothetical protein